MVQNTMKILDHEDAVQKIGPDLFLIISLRTPSRRVRVARQGDQWRCRVDKVNNQDQPCSHILAARIYEGEVDLPNTAPSVYRKGNEARDHGLETRAWELVPSRLPYLLAKLLRQGLPVIAPDPEQNPRGGEPFKPYFPQFYQSIIRAGFLRKSLRCTRGDLRSQDHLQHNPYGPVGIATQSRFLAKPPTYTALEKLLALSIYPVAPYERLVHPDGTGLTEQHFSAYFDERYDKQKRKKREAEIEARLIAEKEGRKFEPQKPRKHHWTFAEILWTYEYTMVAAIHTQRGPFGEAPWLIPLLERAGLMLDVKELGADKAYNAYYIDAYAAQHGIDSQIKVKANANPHYSSGRKRAFKRRIEESRLDPEGFAARANRRNNAETGNHAFKAILGDQIYSKKAEAQRSEILCMCIAYNLTRLVYLELEQGIEADFTGGVEILRREPWAPLDVLYDRYRGRATQTPDGP